MRRLITFFWLELYALVLAWLQLRGGVHTDEAKYLLNIPYPHPPLARFILHLNDSWPFQEFFWRVVFATLLVQAVWFVWKIAEDLKPQARLALGIAWLCNTGLILQAGTIMMAPLTALQAGVFCYLLLRDEEEHDHGGIVALFWLASLFTAYQAALCAPLVWTVLYRGKTSLMWKALYFCVPVALLVLYTLSNPLALASMLIHTDNGAVSLTTKVWELGYVWLLGGSIVVSIAGLYGIIRNRLLPVLCSLLLVAAYVFLARFQYYAILFLPLSMAGVLMLLRKRQMPPLPFVAGVIACSVVFFVHSPPIRTLGPAREAMQMIARTNVSGEVLMKGNFGHEWQYESRLPIMRYHLDFLHRAGALVCLTSCTDLDLPSSWKMQSTSSVIYVRK